MKNKIVVDVRGKCGFISFSILILMCALTTILVPIQAKVQSSRCITLQEEKFIQHQYVCEKGVLLGLEKAKDSIIWEWPKHIDIYEGTSHIRLKHKKLEEENCCEIQCIAGDLKDEYNVGIRIGLAYNNVEVHPYTYKIMYVKPL